MIKTTVAHIVYNPLQVSFAMKLLGGTERQTYDAFTMVIAPNRVLVPLVLQPFLYVQDPDGYIASGDKTTELTNCKWYANGVELSSSTYWTIGDFGRLTLMRNIMPQNSPCSLKFTCDYLDQRRQEVLPFEWETQLVTVDTTSVDLSMTVDVPNKLDLSPFKNRGSFQITAKVFNGSQDVSDNNNLTYHWMYYDTDTFQWVDLNPSSATQFELWCESINRNVMTVNQNYINDKLVAVTAIYGSTEVVQVFRLRRAYHQWEENIDVVEGKYITPETTHSKVEVKVSNRMGNVSDPCEYFDIEILFKPTYSQAWRSISHTTEGTVNKNVLGTDYTQQPTFGALVREKSAFQPLTVNINNVEKVLCVDGKPICVQIPTSTREV